MYAVIVLDDEPPVRQGADVLIREFNTERGTRGLVVAVVDSIAQLGDPATWAHAPAAAVVLDAAHDEREDRYWRRYWRRWWRS